MPTSPLRQLADIISTSVDKIDTAFSAANLQYPSLNEPFNPTSPNEGLSMSPEVIQAATLAVAACAQLSATINVPALSLYDAVGGFHVASGLRAALEGNIVEILRDHPSGVHIKDISVQNDMDAVRIGRVLRLLATHHIFTEVTPDVFRNNRLSSMMDTLKTVEDIKKSPENKHVGTPGMGALIEHSADEVFKGSAFMTEVLADPVMGHSESPAHTPMSYAFKTEKTPFEWYEEPGNEARFKRFAAAMEGSSKVDPPDAILQGFDWSSLPAGSTIVDVGSGLGHIAMKVFKKYPALKVVIQDRASVIEQAKAYWNENSPSGLSSGSVTLSVHDFFSPQPVTNASIFLCRMVVHDYGKSKAITILRHLRHAAQVDTKLLLVEQIVPYACSTANDPTNSIKGGAPQITPPDPLLLNLGKANAIAYLGDFQMFVSNGGEERTLGSFVDLLQGAGWMIEEVFEIPGSIHKQIVAVAV